MTGKRRLLLWLALPLLVVLVLPLSALGLLLTETGSRWVLERVPGLVVTDFQGRLLGQWRAQQLQWQDEQTQVELQQLQVILEPGCLWRGAVCLRQLEAQQLALELTETQEQEDTQATDVMLPDIRLPLHVGIDRLALGQLTLNGELLLETLQLAASLHGSRLQVDKLELAHADYAGRLHGGLQLDAGWPLDVQLEATAGLPELGHQQLQLHISGALQEQIQLSGSLAGVFQGRLQGHAQPLLARLPARLELALEQLHLQSVLPEGLALDSLSLSADGSLEQGFVWQLGAGLQAQQERFSLDGHGQLDSAAVIIKQLRLAHEQQGHVEIQGQATWEPVLNATAQAQVEQFPWQYFAGLEQAPVSIEAARLLLDYTDEHYQGDIQADLHGPAGAFSVNSQLQGDIGQVRLEPLQLTAGSGHVQGVVSLDWAQMLAWDAALEIAQLNPEYWVAGLPGELGGHVRSSGQLAEQLELEIDVQLDGKLRSQPLQARIKAAGQGEHWQLPQLQMQLGDNRIQGQARLEQQLDGQLQIALQRLDQLLPGASGTLQGEVILGGTLEQPDAGIRLTGKALLLEGQRIRDVQLNGQIKQGRSGELELSARGLSSGATALGRLQLKASGELEQHRLQLALQGPLVNADVELEGRLQAEELHWQGQFNQLLLAVENQRWQLQQPLAIDYLHGRHARLATHCFYSEQGRLCAEGSQQLLPQLQLDYRLQDFALSSLQPWLPPELNVEGKLNGSLQLDEKVAGQITGKASLDAGQGNLWLEEEQQRFAWQTLVVQADLLPRQVDARIELRGAEQGHLQVLASIDPRPEDKPVTGRFELRELDLGVLHSFIEDIEHLQGRIQGQGEIAGTLLQPIINGKIELTDGRVGGGMLPVSLEQLQLTLNIAGQQATLNGGWRSGENGQAGLQGEADWAGALAANVRLQGRDLPVFLPPYADLQIAPDVRLVYANEALAVTGTIAVPRGSITVPELPAGSVSLSSDAVVVGREPVASGMDVKMHVTIEVGSERLRFSGFGLNADVEGNLLLADNLSGRGLLELKNGRFRGYGQRLDLRRARLLFSGPLTQPYIDIEAVRVTGDVTAGLRVLGLAQQPQAQVFSEPAMAEEQAMSWLLLGRPLGGGGDSNLLAEAAVGLGLMGALPVTQKLADRLGIDDFQLDSEGSGNEAKVVASGRLTDRLSVRYGVSIFEPGSTLGLRYQLTRRLYLDAASGLVSSLDLFYRRSF